MPPKTLLDALCIASGVQGGTIHQYDLGAIQWRTNCKPSTRHNREGLYDLIYTDTDGGEWCLGFTGGPSIATVRKFHAIDASLKMRYHVEPCNSIAYAKNEQRGG